MDLGRLRGRDRALRPDRAAGLRGGLVALRTEAVLQTLLVFLGFNVAWLLLLDDTRPSRPSPHAKAE